MYVLTNVVKNYSRGRQAVAALRGVDLVVRDSEWLAIQGPTGHGKSTLLQIMGALDRPTSGSVELGGIDLSALREAALTRIRARSIGFVFQTFNLIPTLNAADNVAMALVPPHIAAAERQSRAEEALTAVGLAGRLRHLPSELSGGEQQRVALARALVCNPRLLLADEPTGDLDEITASRVFDLVERLHSTHGLTSILVTHNLDLAARCTRALRLEAGRLVPLATGPVSGTLGLNTSSKSIEPGAF